MDIKRMISLLIDDLGRYSSGTSFQSFIKTYCIAAGFKYSVHLRLLQYMVGKKVLLPLYLLIRLKYIHLSVKYGIQISRLTKIDGGLMIWHYGCTVINGKTVIGQNFGIRPGVVIGNTSKGTPIIGDNVECGANACIIGNVKIGNNVTIGAGAVIVKDIPDNAIVVGNPARIIRYKSEGEIEIKK